MGMLLGTAGIAAATTTFSHPSETDPYCDLERNGAPTDYPGIGWYPEPIVPADQPVGPATVTVCEGEHWDGQDTVAGSSANSGDCVGATPSPSTTNVAVRQCSDPGRMPVFDATNPVGFRASAASTDGGAAAYLFVRINGLGTVGVFQSACTAGGMEAGHFDGARSCQGTNGHAVTGVYAQDDTPAGLNVLAGVISAVRLTKGFASEGDCSQTTYDDSARRVAEGRAPSCGRDNTAITLELLA